MGHKNMKTHIQIPIWMALQLKCFKSCKLPVYKLIGCRRLA